MRPRESERAAPERSGPTANIHRNNRNAVRPPAQVVVDSLARPVRVGELLARDPLVARARRLRRTA